MGQMKKSRVRASVTISVDKESLDTVLALCQKVGQDISGMVDLYLQNLARAIEISKIGQKQRVTRLDLVKLAMAGICQDV